MVNKPWTYSFIDKLSCTECKNSCFEVLLFVVWLNWVLRKFSAIKIVSHDWLMINLEKTWLDHGIKTIFFFLLKRLHSTKSDFIKAIDHAFYGFTGVIIHLECWENTRKAWKSLAFGSWFTSFSRVLPTSHVGYHAGKPIESMAYCLNNIKSHYWILLANYTYIHSRKTHNNIWFH